MTYAIPTHNARPLQGKFKPICYKTVLIVKVFIQLVTLDPNAQHL